MPDAVTLLVFGQGLSLTVELTDAARPASSRDPHAPKGIKAVCYYLHRPFYIGSGSLNSGSNARVINIFPTEPPPRLKP